MLLVFGKGLLNVVPLSTRIDIWICRSCNSSRDYNKGGSPEFLAGFLSRLCQCPVLEKYCQVHHNGWGLVGKWRKLNDTVIQI